MSALLFTQKSGTGFYLDVYIQPKAKVSKIVGTHGSRLKIHVNAAPVDGKANRELVRFLAIILNVNRSSVSLTKGVNSRNKRIFVETLSELQLTKALAAQGISPIEDCPAPRSPRQRTGKPATGKLSLNRD